jgi:hypothetical protein
LLGGEPRELFALVAVFGVALQVPRFGRELQAISEPLFVAQRGRCLFRQGDRERRQRRLIGRRLLVVVVVVVFYDANLRGI